MDRTAVAIATQVLGDCSQFSEEPIEKIIAFDREREKAGKPISGLLPYAEAALIACIDDDALYRQKERELLKDDDLDPALRARLEQGAADDPLLLAQQRLQEDRTEHYGGVYNRVAGPLGRFALSGVMIPFNIVRGVVDIFASENKRDPLSLRQRQALVHWQEYLRENPDSKDARRLKKRVAKFEKLYIETIVEHQLREAKKFLSMGFPDGARFHLEAILSLVPNHREATRLLAIADQQTATRQLANQRSVESPKQWLPDDQIPIAHEIGSSLLSETLLPPPPPEKAAKPLAQTLAFAEANEFEDKGEETIAIKAYGKIAKKRNQSSGMQRHALSIVDRPAENPYRFFRESKRTDGWRRTRWVMFGPLANGPKRRGLFRPLEWVLEAPALINTIVTLPGRLIGYSNMKPWPFGREVKIHADRYLARHPEGEHEDEVLDWMRWFEGRRHNAIGSLEFARRQGGLSPKEEHKLMEKAADQMLLASEREPQPELRMAMLQRTAGEFPNTEAGQKAGYAARELWEHISPQQIRITRGFLLEHPEVAGPRGLGLRRQLLDEEPRNSELHPEGVTILGGRVIRIAYVDWHGDEDEPPEYSYERLSAEHLSRLVALLDETSQRKGKIDRDYEHGADANRDYFFERARLGLTDTPDMRTSAYSSYTFEGVREKYGLVRSRESILPVDLVFQGSLEEMSVGAFPRLRMPVETPDSVLYREASRAIRQDC
ncbi:MAG: hypothetical protein JRC77_06245 [Deltaproteobacteria bacterium]|nr:hypothetical protein [Deltaproteobacteria bacterium]